jgi:hypothetical protein
VIIHTNQRSKKRKPTAKQRQLQAEWDALVQRTQPTKQSKKKTFEVYQPTVNSNIRKNDLPSLPCTGAIAGLKPLKEVRYTGDKMIGIGTLHKSNAVPIFTEEEAKDQANMRR